MCRPQQSDSSGQLLGTVCIVMAIWNLDTFTSWCRIFMQPITQLRSQKQIGQKVFQIQIRGVQRWPFTFARGDSSYQLKLGWYVQQIDEVRQRFLQQDPNHPPLFQDPGLMEVLQKLVQEAPGLGADDIVIDAGKKYFLGNGHSQNDYGRCFHHVSFLVVNVNGTDWESIYRHSSRLL